MQAIGIDLGTTSICGVVIDTESGKVLKSRTENSFAFIESENVWEKAQDPQKIIGLATDILRSFICEETAVIGVTGQMHGIVYYNADGVAVSPLYTWQDERGNLPFENTTYAEHLNSCSGYGNVTDFYNKTNGLVPTSAVGYCTIHDYLVMQLCGLKKALIHVSDAASFGCFDLATGKYSYDCDIQPEWGYKIAGNYNGIPVSVAIGDNQASVFSSLDSINSTLLNVGTGSQISIISDKIINGENIETRPYFEGKYLIVGAALCGGRAYAVLKDFYADVLKYAGITEESKIYGIMDKFLEEGGESLKVDTRFSGTRANQGLRGSISNISTENFTPAALTRGVLEGMVTELYNMYLGMESPKTGIVGSGNGVRKNKALVSIAEEKFGGELKVPLHTEEAAYGAALFALVSSGQIENAAAAQKLIKFM